MKKTNEDVLGNNKDLMEDENYNGLLARIRASIDEIEDDQQQPTN